MISELFCISRECSNCVVAVVVFGPVCVAVMSIGFESVSLTVVPGRRHNVRMAVSRCTADSHSDWAERNADSM